MRILVIRLVVVMHTTVLLLLNLVYPGGHNSPQVLIGDNATKVTNNATLPMRPMVY
jgi:hypothetical protein